MNRLKAIEIMIKELKKLLIRYEKKATAEQEKMEKPYIIVQGQEVYTLEELYEFWEASAITRWSVYEKHKKKLEELIKQSEKREKTENELVIEEIKRQLKNCFVERRMIVEDMETGKRIK